MAPLRTLVALLVVVAPALASCATGAHGRPTAAPASEARSGADLTGDLLVFAAASLTEAFEELGEAFQQAHPAVNVTFSVAGSHLLARQIAHGAPADVFAAAAPAQTDALVDQGLATGEPRVLASNRLTIVVAADNPLGIRTLADLARPDVILVMAAEEVPAGRYAREVLRAADVEVSPASLEVDVRAVLARVSLGEADAGIVYVSDAAAAGDVATVDISAAQNVPVTYMAAILRHAPNPRAARAFVGYARSQHGQAILRRHGLLPP